MRLENGNRVVIVGGGPAGSSTALHMLRYAQAADLRLEVIVLEARDFRRPGPAGCNKCAGVLSSNAVRNLRTMNLDLPPEVIQDQLDTYILHLGGTEVTLRQPDPARRIYSVYRGSGPRRGDLPVQSFDAWLLDQARARGAIVRRAHVQKILATARPTVVIAQEQIQADLVVLATGINSRSPVDEAWGYRPPRTETMVQDEMPKPADFRGGVHIFIDEPPGLIFGGLIPKGRYLNVSLLGHNLSPNAMTDFLASHNLARTFPDGKLLLCGCTPRVVVSPAVGYYADRFVAVGDSAITRLCKDGIGSAFVTAEAAARTAIDSGISREDFEADYRPVCRRIIADNRFGELLFSLGDIPRRMPFLLRAWRRTLMLESQLPLRSRIHTRLLWGLFTGDESYRAIFTSMASPLALLGFLRGVWARRIDR
ncbi:MAG: NAD(P)/FAD-dependent oxidoreductase [Chloroflexi bacterium]|nr:NAD(P)/FAD-dependent oxidoreductase [Chloroflexota bacterium]MCL5273967.1 NAD(P)/FAD-dependent oxidoreductase [Chloroflexota bacterium]